MTAWLRWCVLFPNLPPPHWASWGWGCFCCAAAGIEWSPGFRAPCPSLDSGPGERRIKNPGTAERNAIPGREIAGNSVISADFACCQRASIASRSAWSSVRPSLASRRSILLKRRSNFLLAPVMATSGSIPFLRHRFTTENSRSPSSSVIRGSSSGRGSISSHSAVSSFTLSRAPWASGQSNPAFAAFF